VKKSNLSRNIALSKVAAAGSVSPYAQQPYLTLSGKYSPPISLEQASITPRNAAPVYDAAYLAELKANTASRPLPTAEGEYQDMDVDMHNIPVSTVDPTDADGQTLSLFSLSSTDCMLRDIYTVRFLHNCRQTETRTYARCARRVRGLHLSVPHQTRRCSSRATSRESAYEGGRRAGRRRRR
jgi:hypothetical protein